MKTCHMLLLFVAVILFTTTSAMAADCFHCTEISNMCRAMQHVSGFDTCVNDVNVGCVLSGNECGPISVDQPLTSEYSVAAVERIDQPQPPAKEPLVAPSETEAPPSH